jgi:hypothetical protein
MEYVTDRLLEHVNLGLCKVFSVEADYVRIHFKQDRVARRMSAKHSPLKRSAV